VKKYLRNLRRQAAAAYWDSIHQLADPIPEGRLLDCGCGDGSDTINFAQVVQAAQVEAIELDPDNIVAAKALGIHIHASDLNKPFPVDSNYFDGIVANQVIEHLHNTDRFMTELFRVLKPGGWAIICTENLASWHNIGALMLGYTPFSMTNMSGHTASVGNPLAFHHGGEQCLSTQHPAYQHIRVFTLIGLSHLATIIGFEVNRAVGVGYYPLPVGLWPLFTRLDARHSAFMTLKLVKPQETSAEDAG
jgi:SAM-dependent methyltransferase